MPAPSASASSSAKPLGSGSASAATSASAAPTSTAPVITGPVKWADFTGPLEKTKLKGGEQVWVAMPVSTGWETLRFVEHEVVRVEDETMVVVKANDAEYFLPSIFVRPLEAPKDLKRGDAVMASTHETRVFARVIDVGPRAKIRYRFASNVEELEIEPQHLIQLDGKTLKYGAPVLVQDELRDNEKLPKTHAGQFVSTDGKQTWVITYAGKPLNVPSANVHAMGVAALHKVGEKVWVARQDELAAGVVREALDDGVRYRVQLDAGDEAVVTLEVVTGPMAGTIAH